MSKPTNRTNRPAATDQTKRRLPRQQAPTPPKEETPAGKRRALITVFSIALVIVLVVTGAIWYYQVLPYQRVIIKVDNEAVKIGYLLKRVLINPNGEDVWGTMQAVTEELVITQEAPKMGIPIPTDEEIDSALRVLAQGESQNITDAEFNEWYRQQINSTQLTEKEFRDMVSRSILRQRVDAVLESSVQSVGPQVHLNMIVAKDYDTALKTKERIDGGETFAALAAEVSLDPDTREKGGDVGWVPPAALEDRYGATIAALDIGLVSDPVNNTDPNQQQQQDPNSQPPEPTFSLFLVSEKSVSMEIADQYLQSLKARVLQDWINEQMSAKTITFHGMSGKGGFDSETNAWLLYQAERLKKGMTGTTTTTPAATDPVTGAPTP